jgi:hypothetical protein
MDNTTALRLASLASLNRLSELEATLCAMFPAGEYKRGTWGFHAQKMIAFLRDGVPAFTIFTRGNSKLPFVSFSVLPLVSCPGAGDCKRWCYSLKAWRYPAAFFRQLQNLILLFSKEGLEHIIQAWNKIEKGAQVRLYVDGDVHNLETLAFWFGLCYSRPDLSVYGYSKSWGVFLRWQGEFPTNYTLNLSSGSVYNAEVKAQVAKLPIVRGEFVAVQASVPAPKRCKKTGAPSDLGAWQAYRKAVTEAAQAAGHAKVFVCPGLCGFCSNGKHACGNRAFDGVTIAIGVH